MKIKKLTLFAAFLLFVSVICLLPAMAAGEKLKTDPSVFDDIVLGVGADETQKNVSWYSTLNNEGMIDYAPAENMVSGAFPTEYKTAKATVGPARVKAGYYVNHATITDLQENTEYVYRLRAGTKVSSLYRFNTGSFGDYEFVLVADPQVKSEAHANMWSDTLNKISSNFENVGLVLSAGDQVNSIGSEVGTEIAEEHWSHFFVDELTGVSFAPTPGPAHDIMSADNVFSSYGERFFLPNLSDKYGVTTSTANYWYVYNNTLFLNLNVCDAGAINGEHKQFIMDAMRENPNVAWKVVFIHYPQYSVGDHSHPENQYYEYATKSKREALTPQFTELGIDLVISGHDHLYVRSKIMDGLEVSDDIIIDNTVQDPSGPLYITGGSASGNMCDTRSLSYEDAYYAEVINDEKRKSIVHFTVTDESLTLNAYFLDTDEPELFDTFTIKKTPHFHTPELVEEVKATGTTDGNNPYWYCEGCDRYFTDETCTRITTPEEQVIHAPKLVEKVMATCTTNGNNPYWYCVGCDRCFTDEECNVITTLEEQILPKLGHKWNESTCTSPKTCRNDGCTATQGIAKGHNAPDPTCTEGSVCKRCKETVSEALGHEFSNACDISCNRENCDYAREVSGHVDANSDLLCDECATAIEPPQEGGKDKGNGITVVVIVSAVTCVLAAATVIILKKKRH